jgi:hypothetical protein
MSWIDDRWNDETLPACLFALLMFTICGVVFGLAWLVTRVFG